MTLATVERKPFYTACPVCRGTQASEVVAFQELRFGRCADCGLIYKLEQVPGLGGNGYDEHYFRTNRAGYLKRWDHRVRKCLRQILVCLEYAPQAKNLLDIGCSAGYVLEAARRLRLEPTGLDLSEFTVKLCRERGYRAEQGSMMELPFPGGSFDIITLKHTLEHVEDPMRALREIHRVLRVGGVAFVIVPDAAYYKIPLMPRRGRSFRPDRRGWQHHVYFYEQNLAQAAQLAGFTPLKAGKAILRRRLARGARAPFELLRFGYLLAWTWVCRVTHLRREIQLIAGKSAATARSTSEALPAA